MVKYVQSLHITTSYHAFCTNKFVSNRKFEQEIDFSLLMHQDKFTKKALNFLASKAANSAFNQTKMVLTFLNQTHSSKAIIIDNKKASRLSKADGMATKEKGIALCILSADCAPLLFFDQRAKVIGAAHAGWRGALGGVAEATVDKMVEIGATRKNIFASIGPCISRANYEVDDIFKEQFTSSQNIEGKFFTRKSTGKHFFDLPNYISARLKHYGLAGTSWIGYCTYENKDFHSYRRAIHNKLSSTKRNISIITL